MVCFTGSVDFYNQHKVGANNPTPVAATARLKSAPALKTTTKPTKAEPHWITWNSGALEPPGLQKRLHRPWPTPEPPRAEDERSYSRNFRPSSGVARPVFGTLLPTNPTVPVPDMLGSEGVHPTLTRDREQAFTPQPATLPASQSSSRKASNPFAYFM